MPFFSPSIQRARCWALQGVSHANGAKTFRTPLGREHAVTQAVEAWDYPQPFDNVASDDMRWMGDEVRHQKYRYDPRSPDWVGLAPAKHLGLDPRADRKKLNAIRASVY